MTMFLSRCSLARGLATWTAHIATRCARCVHETGLHSDNFVHVVSSLSLVARPNPRAALAETHHVP